MHRAQYVLKNGNERFLTVYQEKNIHYTENTTLLRHAERLVCLI